MTRKKRNTQKTQENFLPFFPVHKFRVSLKGREKWNWNTKAAFHFEVSEVKMKAGKSWWCKNYHLYSRGRNEVAKKKFHVEFFLISSVSFFSSHHHSRSRHHTWFPLIAIIFSKIKSGNSLRVKKFISWKTEEQKKSNGSNSEKGRNVDDSM